MGGRDRGSDGPLPQNRAGFLMSLALWGGLCSLVATLLRNFAA
jgi:hypothetical protein